MPAQSSHKQFQVEVTRLLAASAQSIRGLARADLHHDHLHAYVRIGPRTVGKRHGVMCLQIANLNTPEPYRGKGGFKQFLLDLRGLTDLPFFAENVQEDRLVQGLVRLGFEIIRVGDLGLETDLFRQT